MRKVREHPFVMVVGRSGSGKSSLVYAGLLPALRRERDGSGMSCPCGRGLPRYGHWRRPSIHARTTRALRNTQQKLPKRRTKLRTGDPELLSHMIREELDQAEGKPDRLLLYIDQWEELYAQAPSSSDKERAAQHAADVNRFIDCC